MMNKKYLEILKPAMQQMGYELVELGEANNSGFYRPRVKNLKGSINTSLSIAFDGNNTFYLTDFAEQNMEKLTVKVDTSEIKATAKDEMPSSLASKTEEERKEFEAKRTAAFLKSYNSIVKTEEELNSLLEKKKITKYGSAFIGKDYQFKNGYKAVQLPLVVPFYSSPDTICGAQICFLDDKGKSKKFAVPGSTFKKAYNVLQEGERIEVVNKVPVFICESYTTACEVAEAQPKATVICSAGIGNMTGAWQAYRRKDHFTLFVCDKTEHNEENAALDKLMKYLVGANMPYLQLDKTDTCLLDMTDFNDYAVRYGKTAVKREIDIQAKQWLPLAPEVLAGSSKFYNIVSRVNNKIMEIARGSAVEKRDSYANRSFWWDFDKIHYISKDEDGKVDTGPILTWLNLGEARNAETIPMGVGIHKDLNGYVMNSYRGRFMNTDKGTQATFDLKPLGDNIYINCSNDKKELNLSDPFTKVKLNKLLRLWTNTFDIDKSYLLGLLGFCVQATYATFSPRRAHIWITGPSGSGKSAVILERFIYQLLRGLILPTENVTDAGISQHLAPPTGEQNSPLVTIDEAGSDSTSKSMRMSEVIKLARETATNDGSKVSLRGTKDQDGRVYRRTCALALASVTENLDDIQELSRFILFNISPHLFKLKQAKEFDDLKTELEELNPCFLRACLEGAKHFEPLFGLVNDKIRGLVPSNAYYAQKLATLTACVAGSAVLLKLAHKCSDEVAVEKTMKHCDAFIKSQLTLQKEKYEDVNSIRENIINFDVMLSGDPFDLTAQLADDIGLEYYKKYGIFLKDNAIFIKHTGSNIDNLVQNKRLALTPIFNLKGKLIDAVESDDKVSLISKRCPLNNKSVRKFFKVEL